MEDRERKKGPGTQLWDIRTLNSEHEEEAAKETEEERPVRQKKTGRVLNGRPGRVATASERLPRPLDFTTWRLSLTWTGGVDESTGEGTKREWKEGK